MRSVVRLRSIHWLLVRSEDWHRSIRIDGLERRIIALLHIILITCVRSFSELLLTDFRWYLIILLQMPRVGFDII
jgi:hypothetical protein